MSDISVIVPVYNGENYINEAIGAAIEQSYPPSEIIIIDDGSTDSTAMIAQQYPQVSYIYQKNAGPGAARNRGIQKATGAYLAFLDADDFWPAYHLERLRTCLLDNPDAKVAVGRTRYVYQAGADARMTAGGKHIQDITHVLLPSALFRCEVFDEVGLFSQETGEDVDWYLRAAELGIQPVVIDDVVLYHRIHDSNMTAARDKIRADFLQVVKASLDRRRLAASSKQQALLPWVRLHPTE